MKFEMPDLPSQLPGLEKYRYTDVPALVVDGHFKNTRILRIAMVFVYFLEKAVEEYRLAHAALVEASRLDAQLEASPATATTPEAFAARFRARRDAARLFANASHHLELCALFLRRSILVARRYRKDPDRPAHYRSVTKLTVFSDTALKRVKRIRNAVEHVDEKFIKGEIDGTSVAVTGSSLAFAGETIYYTELVTWLRELDSLVFFTFPGIEEYPDEHLLGL